ncbi:hypothetical protein [Agromyces sp. NPDC058126]|uniref:hypothetical protein n=1 Tax=Agromyces sp. NPDC058126 TaxID=3346350 RepID=UPI0036DDA661
MGTRESIQLGELIHRPLAGRCSSGNDRRPDERRDEIALELAKDGSPVSLTTREVRATGRRVEPQAPVPVIAKVRYRVVYEEPRNIGAEAIDWTRGATFA